MDWDWDAFWKNMPKNDSSEDSDNSTDLSHSKLQGILDKKGDAPRIQGVHVMIIILSSMAILINCMTLSAIRYIRRRLTANQTMMFSLCCADLLTALSVMAEVINDHVFARHMVSKEQKYSATCVYEVIQALVVTGHNATLLNLMCLAIDHYCAIAKPLTYSLHLSKRTVRCLLLMFWFLAVLFGFSDFFIPSKLHGYSTDIEIKGYCDRVWYSAYEPDHLMFCVMIVCLIVMSNMYGGIMCILRSYQRQEYSTASQRKAQRHIRGLITSFIILGLFTVLWLPNVIMDMYVSIRIMSTGDPQDFKVHYRVFPFLNALLIVNAICDPIVYAMRMKEIQSSLKLLMCFKQPTFSNKRNGFGDALRNRTSTTSANVPLRFIRRQYSSNSTNTTVCSGVSGTSMSERQTISRKGTITSQGSEMTEDTPLSGNASMSQFDVYMEEETTP